MKEISVVRITKTETGPGEKIHMHAHANSLELMVVAAGRGNYYSEGDITPFGPGDVIVAGAGVTHGLRSDEKEPFTLVETELIGIREEGLPVNCMIPPGMVPVLPCVSPEESDVLVSLSLYCAALWEDGEGGESGVLESLKDALICLVRQRILSGKEKPERRKSETAVIGAIRYMDRHFAEGITLASLASALYISPYYLARKFREMTGVTINTYLTNCRVGEAQRLLTETDLPIKEIAQRCGFQTLQYFYQVFRKVTGMTPAVYREERQGE